MFGPIKPFSGLGMMFSRFGDGLMGFVTLIFGLVILVVGSLLTRIYCKLMIVFIKMQESLHSIDQKLDK